MYAAVRHSSGVSRLIGSVHVNRTTNARCGHAQRHWSGTISGDNITFHVRGLREYNRMSTTKSTKRTWLSALFAAMMASLVTVAAAQALAVADVPEWGDVLVTEDGLSLYLYVLDADAGDGFACVDACLNNWPPLLADSVEALVAAGLDAELVGVRERADGTLQATYGDWPLYRSRRDQEPGQTRGQGVGSQFYLVGLDGNAVTQSVEVAATEVPEAVFAALMAEGLTQFSRNCMACHGAEGQGGAGPRLAGMQALSDTTFIAGAIIQGRTHHGMPAFGGILNDEEIAAVATYVRNAWGNDFGPVIAEEVGPVR